ncbi:Bax inhibitor-1/YccA family protein [Streptomyces sp. NPDC052225]|uniref:Bax inhibitor-1/YccA family membrane protein n=1 Tax=Streptomyces sp. NPDC052225 TaxID=3154949 RepID=UPI0034135A05
MTPVEQQRWLKSSNPVLSRPQFTRRGGQKTAIRDPRSGIAVVRDRIGAGTDRDPGGPDATGPLPALVGDLLTMDDVLPRAATSLGVCTLTAVLSWTVFPLAGLATAVSYAVAACAAAVAAALVVAQCRRSRSGAWPALSFAVCEGLFLGVLSATVSSHLSPGVLVQTVLATMATSAAALFARAMHWIRVTRRWHGHAGVALLGLAVLAWADWFLVSLLGPDRLGLHPFGLGAFMGVVGIVLAVSFLPLHFRQIEEGITHGTPRDQAWPAAFGLTLTLVWLYVETVRLLTLYPADDVY